MLSGEIALINNHYYYNIYILYVSYIYISLFGLHTIYIYMYTLCVAQADKHSVALLPSCASIYTIHKKGMPKRTWKDEVEEESMKVGLRRKDALCRSKWSVGMNKIAAGLR